MQKTKISRYLLPAEEFRTRGYGHARALFLFTAAFPSIEWFLFDYLLIIKTVKTRLDKTCVG